MVGWWEVDGGVGGGHGKNNETEGLPLIFTFRLRMSQVIAQTKAYTQDNENSESPVGPPCEVVIAEAL